MNKQIFDLADKAGADVFGDDIVVTNHFDIELFVKLIIQEGIDALNDAALQKGDVMTTVGNVSKQLKTHFGIK